jgi:hypothetical protein
MSETENTEESSNSIGSIKELAENAANIQSEYFEKLNKILKYDDSKSNESNRGNKIKKIIQDFVYVKTTEHLNVELEATHLRIVIDLLKNIFPLYSESFINENNNDSNQSNHEISLLKEIMSDLVLYLNIITFSSLKTCNFFIEENGLKILFEYLTCSKLLDIYLTESTSNSQIFETVDWTFRRLMGSLVCLARVYNSYKKEFKELNSVNNLLYYLNKTKTIIDNKVYSCLCIAFIADDDDIDQQLHELKLILPDLCKMVGEGAKMIKTNTDLYRQEVQLDDDGGASSTNQVKEVCCITHMDTSWSIINLLKALYHISVSDKLKYDIYYKNNMNKHLRMIILHGNEVEQEYCLRLLWQLCFDRQIAQDVKQDIEFYEFLKSIENTDSKSLKKNVSGILWQIENSSNQSSTKEFIAIKQKRIVNIKTGPTATQALDNSLNKNGKHIMISYNRDSRDLCLKIKSDLEKLNYKVWIDVEDIHGSSLESMSNAIEQSVCVLMCMTEKYKQSVNCRAEAEYAFQLSMVLSLFVFNI